MKAMFETTQLSGRNSIGIFCTFLIGAAICLAAGAGQKTRAATIVVNTTSDGFILTVPGQPSPCRLRDAITAANTNLVVAGCVKGDPSPTVDTIMFNVGAGVAPTNTPTIKLLSMLPPITEPVYIRGNSGGAARIELDGSGASWRAALVGQRAHGLFVFAGDSTIRNLVINRFNGNGIVLTTNTGEHIGDFTPPEITDPTIPVIDPCYPRPDDPGCQSGGGGSSPDIPTIGGAGARNRILGCFIGTDASGTLAMGNGSGLDTAGIVTTTDMHTIGGPSASDRNVISGNHGHGLILGGKAQWVRGNYIGTDVTGTLALGNEFDGINIAGGQFSSATGAIGANHNSADTQCNILVASNGFVTNDRRECGNRIAFNYRNGISGGFNSFAFLSNSIHSNGALGIDVDQFGLTPNSANRSRNFPVLTWWRREFNLQNSTVGTRVFGSITNQFSQPVTIQFFHSPGCDSSGNGEGRQYLGSITLSGNGSFAFYLPYIGGVVTATSTTKSGVPKTSEFSACLPI